MYYNECTRKFRSNDVNIDSLFVCSKGDWYTLPVVMRRPHLGRCLANATASGPSPLIPYKAAAKLTDLAQHRTSDNIRTAGFRINIGFNLSLFSRSQLCDGDHVDIARAEAAEGDPAVAVIHEQRPVWYEIA